MTITSLEALLGTTPPTPPTPLPTLGWITVPPEGGGALPALLFADTFTMGADSAARLVRWHLTGDGACGDYTLVLWWWWNDADQQVEMWLWSTSDVGEVWDQVMP